MKPFLNCPISHFIIPVIYFWIIFIQKLGTFTSLIFFAILSHLAITPVRASGPLTALLQVTTYTVHPPVQILQAKSIQNANCYKPSPLSIDSWPCQQSRLLTNRLNIFNDTLSTFFINCYIGISNNINQKKIQWLRGLSQNGCVSVSCLYQLTTLRLISEWLNFFSSSIILFSIKLVSWFCLLTTICLLHQVLIYILIKLFLKFHHTIFNKTCQLILPFNHNLSSSQSADLHINKPFSQVPSYYFQ